jgi:ABC-type Fe3+-hydroxamate transport system substrate-binding protein
MTAISRRSALILPLAAALPSRARAAMPPFADAAGRTVNLPAPAERIVLGFNFEEFTAVAGVAGWQRVVGINRRQWEVNRQALWRRYAAVIPQLAAMPDVGEIEEGSFSVERVLALRPDLLIMLAVDYTAQTPIMAQIEQAGVPIMLLDFQAQLPAKHIAGTLALGAATGNMDRAHALADLYRDRVGDIVRRVAGAATPKAYVELGAAGAGVVGNTYNNAMWGRMVDTAGGANIAKGRIPGGWGQMSPEYVLAAGPDFVFITGSSWANAPNAVRTGFDVDLATTRRSLAPYAQRPGWSGLPAIQRGELHAVDAGLARALCDWTGQQYLAKQMHPELFADVDPAEELRRYYETYLPVAFDGTWMARLTPRSA